MTKSESKYFNTALLMDQALMELLKKKDFAYISVKELCQKAGVNRSTFYLHYESMNDLLDEAMEETYSDFAKEMGIEKEDIGERIAAFSSSPLEELNFINDQYLLPYLKYVKEHLSLFKAVFERPSSFKANDAVFGLYRHVFEPILGKFGIKEEDKKYVLDYYLSGLMAVVRRWVNKGCVESIEHISSLMEELVGAKKKTDFSLNSVNKN